MVTVVKNDSVEIERLSLGPFGTNAYIVTCLNTKEAAVVEAPADTPAIIEALKYKHPVRILLTHDHADHTGALQELRDRLGVPLAAHELDSKKLSRPPEQYLKHGDVVKVGDCELRVLHTPGHTPGSLCFRAGKYVLAGDTLFPGGPGKTASPEAFRQIISSITDKIFPLPEETELFPGHGEPTTVGKAKEEYTRFASRPHSEELFGDVLWLSS